MSKSIVIGKLNEPKEFEWEIPNFSSFSKTSGNLYHSPSFNFANTSWHLVLRLGIKYLSVYLDNEYQRPIHVSYAFSIKDVNGRLIGKTSHASTCEVFCGFPNFFLMSSLEERGSHLIPSDMLTIVCQLKLSYGVERTVTDVLEAKSLGEQQCGVTSEQTKFTGNNILRFIYYLYYIHKNNKHVPD